MNAKTYEGTWHEEAALPNLITDELNDGQILDVKIKCGWKRFTVELNGEAIRQTFVYHYPLLDVDRVQLCHGTCGNKWIWLHVT